MPTSPPPPRGGDVQRLFVSTSGAVAVSEIMVVHIISLPALYIIIILHYSILYYISWICYSTYTHIYIYIYVHISIHMYMIISIMLYDSVSSQAPDEQSVAVLYDDYSVHVYLWFTHDVLLYDIHIVYDLHMMYATWFTHYLLYIYIPYMTWCIAVWHNLLLSYTLRRGFRIRSALYDTKYVVPRRRISYSIRY